MFTDTYFFFFLLLLCLNMLSWELEVKVQTLQGEIVIFQRGSCKRNSLNLKCYLFLMVLKSSNFFCGPFKNTPLLSCICQAEIFM